MTKMLIDGNLTDAESFGDFLIALSIGKPHDNHTATGLKHIRNLSIQNRIKKVYSIDESEIEDEEWPDDETISLIKSIVSNELSDASVPYCSKQIRS